MNPVGNILLRGPIRRNFSSTSSSPLILRKITEQAQLFGVNPDEAYNPTFIVESFQSLITFTHGELGFSWPSSLLLLATSFRAITLPLYVSSTLKGMRRAEAAQQLGEVRALAKEAVLLRDQTLVNVVDREYKQRMQAYGLSSNLFQGFGYLLLVQMPWVTTTLFALRGMSTQPELFSNFITDSRLLWCESMALSDPYGILPVLSSSVILLSSSYARVSVDKQPRFSVEPLYLKYAFRGACFTFVPFAMHLPAGIVTFFIFNTVFNRLASYLIRRFIWKPLPSHIGAP